jgi:hypothetical protein
MRRGRPDKIIIVALSASFVLIAIGLSKMARADRTPQTPAELWLSWSADARAEYVHGYIEGFERGKRDACYFYEEKVPTTKPVPPEKLPARVCLDNLPDFTEPYYQVYVDTITNYYTKYPHDREGGLTLILDELAVPPGLKSIDQIHTKLGNDDK